MPSAFDQLKSSQKKTKIIKSAYDSESFDADGTIHVDGLVGSATISPSGRDVALASPEGLAIIDLDSPYSPPRRLSSHGSPWLVVDVQWSPFAARDYWVTSTANHRCLVWNLNLRDDSTSGAIEHSLQGHSRAITDINFSAHHPDSLATCSVDGYVHCWDLRRPRQPAITFCDWFAGATQVKYSRQDPFIIASSHDRWLHIWDERKCSEPLRSISAHTSKIYGIDWNRTRASAIVTCSLDKSIKFWDYEKEGDVPERVIRTDFPVWRARHTPFAWGLLAMPQNEPGNLYLFDGRMDHETPTDGPVEPVAVFEGHGDHKAKEFLWRTRGGISDEGIDSREFQLVSWGEDNKLRLTRPEPSTLEGVGYVKGMEAEKNVVLTRQGATYKTFRTVDDGSHHRRAATMSDPHAAGMRQSALTLGMKIPSYRTGPSWRGPSMKAKSTNTRKVDRSQAQMNWMKGITMTKRKTSSDSPNRTASKDSSIFGPFLQQDYWAEPETLQEEFVRISEQLPNVKWDSIDMDSLILNASLKGPWGVDEEDIFLKVKVDIPRAYPKTKAPSFIIENNAFMPEGTHEKLEREVHQIGEQYLKRKQNCLAAAFSYLLGETNLAESTNFFRNVRDLDDIDVLADESSSEDSDNDIPAGGSAAMSQDLTASIEIENTLAPISRPTLPPVYRTCGARFSNDGRLVTFFPTKEAKALLFSPNDTFKEKPKDQPTFAGFGRLTHDSPPPRKRYLDGEASAVDDLSAFSDDSEDSSSSSDSELTTMHKISLWYRPGRRLHKTWSANDSLRSSGGGTGAGTGTGTGTSRRRAGRPKNVVKLFDVRDMLPSKKQFAQEYAIFGNGAQVCAHNAQVAERYGYPDMVNIWKYAALLLRSNIPLEMREPRQKNKSVLVIAKDVLARYRDGESSANGAELLTGRVKWGNHPLAQEFVKDLFEYFEQLADVQMLAMLSCIFGESSTDDPVPYAESRLPQPETPLPMKAPSFSLEYFPTDAMEWGMQTRSGYSSVVHTPRTSQTPLITSDPQSPDGLWIGEPGSQSYSNSTGETPPQRSLRDYLSDVEQTQSLSTSPNDRSMRRSQSSVLTTTFASNLSRGFTSMTSSSPPSRKRPSPAETILSHIPSNITWGGSTYFGAGQPDTTETTRTSISDDDFRRDELVSMVPVNVNITLENEMAFDDDGWLSTPLLDPTRDAAYASYRYAYAEMLQVWQLPLARLEIMKFNVFKDSWNGTTPGMENGTPAEGTYHESDNHDSGSHSATGTTSPTVLLGSKRSQLAALNASGRGLDVTGICRVHEIQLQPLQYSKTESTGGAVGICERCRHTQTQLTCVFCHEPMDALYSACLGCGCATHDACLAEWHGMGETECPAGDDCACVEEADKGQVETWVAMRAALAARER
ncbi:WD40 repeat-like protein, partial [Cryphonectria parasitica EP155]